MNRLQLREGTYDRMGVPQDDAQLTTSVVDRMVNDALHMIEVEHEWPWLLAKTTITTASGTGEYAVPTDWLRTRYLQIDGGQPLEGVEIGELIGGWPDSASRGTPSEYAIDVDSNGADVVLLRAIPDTVATVTHYYVRREPDLNSDSDSPLMPASFHAAICEKAAWIGLRRTRENDRAMFCDAAYKEWAQRMLDDRRRRSGTTRVKVRPDSWV